MALIIQHYFTGKWKAEEDFERTYREGLRIGKYWTTLTYIYYSGMCAIESGRYPDCLNCVRILHELAESLDITYAMILRYRLTTMGYLRFRKLEELQEISEKSIEFIQTTGDDANLFMVYCMSAQGCVYLGKPAEAKQALDIVADKIGRHSRVPIFHSQYLLSHLEYEFLRLESLESRTPEYKSAIRKLEKLSDTFVARSKKNPATLTTAYLMKARLAGLLKKNGHCVAAMKKAIRAGEKYGGRVNLSRAYFEAGKLLSDPDIRTEHLNGLTAEDYFQKAKTLFEEMELQRDLGELRKVRLPH